MKRQRKALYISALAVIILPFTGFPYMFQTVLFIIAGVCVAYAAYTLPREKEVSETQPFTENSQPKEETTYDA